MVKQLMVSMMLFVSSAYAGMCGESDGTVRCTEDAGKLHITHVRQSAYRPKRCNGVIRAFRAQ